MWIATSTAILALLSVAFFPLVPAHAVTSGTKPALNPAQLSTITPAIALKNAAVHVSGHQLVDATGKSVELIGVDASGTEDACIDGKGFSWGPMDSAEARSIALWHANSVRVPLNEDCWLGINGVDPKYSGNNYRTQIKRWVSTLNAAGLVAILDLQWSAPANVLARSQWPMADADHSVTFWSEVASAFRSDRGVIFDLFS